MKKILLLASSLAVFPLITSCTDYGVYGYSTTVARPLVTNVGVVGGTLAPMQVGFVATSINHWAWDPYRRCYFDRSCGRYFDPRLRRYCTVVPHRYPVAVYPSGYRHGARLACPSYLPRNRAVVHHHHHHNHNPRGRNGSGGSGGRYAPVVHGSSRGVAPLRSTGRTGEINRNSSFRESGSTDPIIRTVTPQSSRRSTSPSTVTRSSRLKTISTAPTRNQEISRQPAVVSRPSGSGRSSSNRIISTPVASRPSSIVRNPTVSRSRPTVSSPSPSVRSTPTVRSTGSASRSTSGGSRSISRARQRTR